MTDKRIHPANKLMLHYRNLNFHPKRKIEVLIRVTGSCLGKTVGDRPQTKKTYTDTLDLIDRHFYEIR